MDQLRQWPPRPSVPPMPDRLEIVVHHRVMQPGSITVHPRHHMCTDRPLAVLRAPHGQLPHHIGRAERSVSAPGLDRRQRPEDLVSRRHGPSIPRPGIAGFRERGAAGALGSRPARMNTHGRPHRTPARRGPSRSVLTLPGGGRAEEAPPRPPNDVRCGRRNYRCGSLPAAFSPTCLNHVAPARITLAGGGQVSVAGAVAACCPASSTHRTSGNCTDLWQRWGVAHDDLA